MQIRPCALTILAASCLAAVLAAAGAGAAPPEYTAADREWATDLGTGPIGVAAELRSGAVTRALVVTLATGRILLMTPDGRIRCSMDMDFRTEYPSVAGIVDRSGQERIIGVDSRGSVYGFSLQGKRLWKVARDARPGGFRVTVLADLESNGLKEALVSDGRGNLVAVDGQGRVRLEVVAGRYRVCPPAVGDVDGDGLAEIFFGTDEGDMFCVGGDGRVRWARRLEGRFGRSLPLIADPNRDGRYQVYVTKSFVGARAGMYALDARTGRLLWKAPALAQSYQSTVAADLDGDGRDEILFSDKTSRVYCQDGHGRRKWEAQLEAQGIPFSSAIADLPGAGGVRIFVAANASSAGARSLQVLDASGNVVGVFATPVVSSSPLICRFPGSDRLSMLVFAPGNKLVCYRLPATTGPARILWKGTRNDVGFTGFAARPPRPSKARTAGGAARRMYPVRTARIGTNRAQLTPPKGAVRVALQVSGADVPTRTRVTILGEDSREAALPFVADKPGRYLAIATWLRADGTVVGDDWLGYTVHATAGADAADTRKLVRELLAPGRTAPHFELRAALAAEAPALLAHARLAGTPRAYDEARWQRESWLALARFLRKTPAGASVLVRPIHNPWVDFDGRGFLVSQAAKAAPAGLSFRMLGNAYSSEAIAVTNLQPQPVTLRIECGTFALDGSKTDVPAGRVVQVREVPLVRLSTTGLPAEDPLPLLGEAQTVRLGLGETRKLWLTFRSRDIAPGTYRSTFLFGDPAYQTATQSVPLTLEVLPLRLPDKRVFRHGNWVYLASIPDARLRDAIIEDELEHGCNVFNIPGITVDVDAQGRIVGTSTESVDALLRKLHARGAFFMINGSVGVSWPSKANPDEVTRERAWADALRWYGQHMLSLGIPFTDYALYLMDEPGLHGDDERYRDWANSVRRVKAAEPRMQVYSNPAGAATPDMLRPLEDLVDAWQPDLHMVKEQPKAYHEVFRKARYYWHYEAPGDQRNIDPLGWYRMQPWVSFAYDMDGGGYWVYGSSEYWLTDPVSLQEYGAVYLGPTGPVSTRRWEATREGIQDFELLWMLREAARRDGDAGRADLALIDEAVSYVTKGQERVSDISRQVEPICPDYDRWMAYRERIVQALLRRGVGK